MNKNLHFIAGRSSAGTLRQFLQQQNINDDVLAIEGAFEYEPLINGVDMSSVACYQTKLAK